MFTFAENEAEGTPQFATGDDAHWSLKALGLCMPLRLESRHDGSCLAYQASPPPARAANSDARDANSVACDANSDACDANSDACDATLLTVDGNSLAEDGNSLAADGNSLAEDGNSLTADGNSVAGGAAGLLSLVDETGGSRVGGNRIGGNQGGGKSAFGEKSHFVGRCVTRTEPPGAFFTINPP